MIPCQLPNTLNPCVLYFVHSLRAFSILRNYEQIYTQLCTSDSTYELRTIVYTFMHKVIYITYVVYFVPKMRTRKCTICAENLYANLFTV